jgi:hypothetical protein
MVTLQSMNRWKAFGIHLALSAVIAASVMALVIVVWYPPPYFDAMGGEMLLRLLIGIDVVLGPLITLIVFNPAKPRLKFDLATIAVLQLAALVYGGYVMFEARPVYNVFVKDRFETVPANGIDEASLARAKDEFRSLPLSGPRVVAAKPPSDPDESFKVMTSAMSGGPDVAQLPHLYTPYDTVGSDAARAARPMVDLSRQGKDSATVVSDFISTHGNGGRSLGYLPVRARNKDFVAVVDRRTGEFVGYLAVNPW